jgi:hypothetical protein
MYWTRDKLFELLPSVYRQRDEAIAADKGLETGPLGALLDVIATELVSMEAHLEQSYDNHFIETCEPWVLAYIGNLLGIEGLPVTRGSAYSPRAFVANTLSYRRRKGTPGMLEQLARDTTGWYARVTEYFLLLAPTRHLNRRSGRLFSPDIRQLEPLERLDSPFAESSRLPEVRNIDGPHAGRYNIPSVGIHLWPLKVLSPPDATGTPASPAAPYAVEARPASFPPNPGEPVARWYLHPLGQPTRLFNRPLSRDPASAAEVTALAEERDVPDALRRLPLHKELESLRDSIANGQPRPRPHYFGGVRPVIQLFVDNEPDPIPDEEIRIVDFSKGWPQPDPVQTHTPQDGGPSVDLPIRVALDPARGMVAFAAGKEPSMLRSVHALGFSEEMGGGPYDRQKEERGLDPSSLDWQMGVSRLHTAVGNTVVPSIGEAVAAWNALPPGSRGLICIMDSMRYEEALTGPAGIRIPEGSQLWIVAAGWPEQETDPGIFERVKGTFSPHHLRPHLMGDLELTGTAPAGSDNPGALHVEGILHEGRIRVATGNLGTLSLSHCSSSLVSSAGLEIQAAPEGPNRELSVGVRKCILAGIRLHPDIASLRVEDSLVGLPDDPSADAIAAESTGLHLERSTVWGGVRSRMLHASECILLGLVEARRRQVGCVRYSWLPKSSVTPRQFRCQPNVAIEEAGVEGTPMEDSVILRVSPQFASTDPFDPEFARLTGTAPFEIREGAEGGREMGAFNALEEPLRRRFLQGALDEYVRAGIQAGLLFETTTPSIQYGPTLH